MCWTATLLAPLLAATSLAQEPKWQPLFDGETLDGWVRAGGDATYRVEDGTIVGASVPNTKNTFLCTEQEYADFELELEFKVNPTMNSGVQFRSAKRANDRVFGYQCEIDPSKRAWTCGIFDESRRGWLANLKKNPKAQKAFRQGKWNRMRIKCIGAHLQTWINNVPAADHIDAMSPSGFIALQVHGVGQRKDPLEVRWRNLRIRDLGSHEWEELDKRWQIVNSANGEPKRKVMRRDDFAAGATMRWKYQISGKSTLSGAFGTVELPPTGRKVRWRELSVTRTDQRCVVHIDGKVVADVSGGAAKDTTLTITGGPKTNGIAIQTGDQLVRLD